MNSYTVVCDYGATGEGRTLMILYVMAISKQLALDEFVRTFVGGSYYAQGADVIEGFDFDCDVARVLVTPQVQNQLSANCMKSFSASLHYNYS